MRKILFVLLVMGSFQGLSQELNPKVASMFVFNFTKYVKWPENAVGNEFVIGVMADEHIMAEFTKMASLKNFNSKKIVLKLLIDVKDAVDCNLIYIGAGKHNKMKEFSLFASTKPILLIGDNEDATRKGACIGLYIDEDDGNKTKFHLNKESVEKRGLKVANELISLSE